MGVETRATTERAWFVLHLPREGQMRARAQEERRSGFSALGKIRVF